METSQTQSKLQIAGKLILVFGILYVFLVSIGLMAAAFKGYGKDFAENLITTTSNPFIGLFVGILATSLVQSSSTTTSIVVGMVAGGVLSISGAVPIIFGANIGTTVTNLLVALGHFSRREEFKRAIAGASVHDFFNLICVIILFPLELLTGYLEKSATFISGVFLGFDGATFNSPIKAATKPVIKWLKHFIIDFCPDNKTFAYSMVLLASFVLMYFALFLIVKVMRTLVANQTENVLNKTIGGNGLIGIFVGTIFTIIVQSSSITTSILVPIVASGIITIETVFPITLGANIGTTSTALLASMATGNPSAVIIALVHFLFNMTGVLFIYPITVFRKMPIRLAYWLGEVANKRRRYAVLYVLCLFFIIPGLLIFLSKLF